MADAGTIRKPAVGTLTRADLADIVHREIGLSRADSAGIVERILHHMCHALAEGQNVKISGFGSFILRDKGERIGRNPKTGVEVPIAPRRVLTFRASQIMRERIAEAIEGSMGEPIRKSEHAFRTIGELASDLGVPQHILRYWETRFPQLRPLQRAGNRRYYRPDDVALARRIHRLLNQDGYTIRGVQQLLARGGTAPGEAASPVTSPAPANQQDPFPAEALRALRRSLVEALEETQV